MRRFRFCLLLAAVLLAGCASSSNLGKSLQTISTAVLGANSTQTQASAQASTQSSTQGGDGQLPETRVAAGLRAALADGAAWAVSQLGQTGGFWSHPARRIPLPHWVQQASSILRMAGYSQELKQLHLTMNRAAEKAVGEVGEIVRHTIMNMSVADAYAVLNGGKHAATQYLREHASEELANRIRPIVANATAQSTAARRYQSLVSKAKPLLALASINIPTNLNRFVTHKAMDALFELIAKQEAKIRANPLARGTELLRAVFGRQ